MDQAKIGLFIATCRKGKKLTQAALAEQLGITDRAVSKWENGKSMPDISIMMELCSILEINVNELLTGERIIMEDYIKKAEDNLLELTKQEEINNKRLLAYEKIIGCTSSVTFVMLVFAASFAVTSNAWRAVMMIIAAAIFTAGMISCLKIEHDAGYYECPHCGKRYVPTMKAVVLAPHMGNSRKMKCPFCEKRGYHKKAMTK